MSVISEPNAPQPGTYEMVRRMPCGALNGIVSALSGYREYVDGHYRQQEAASLTIPLVISFGAPFSIGLGGLPGHNDRVASFASGLFAGPVVIDFLRAILLHPDRLHASWCASLLPHAHERADRPDDRSGRYSGCGRTGVA
jgi:hypothetical protein